MDMNMEEMELLMKGLTFDQWKDFASKVIDLHEREIGMLLRHIQSVEKLRVADKSNLDRFREVIQQDLQNIETIKKITKDLEYAKAKIGDSSTKTSKADSIR